MHWTRASGVLAILLAAVDAGCTDAKYVNGRLEATCTDEVTGNDFQYIDFDGTFRQDSGASQSAAALSLNNQVYDWYEDAPDYNRSTSAAGLSPQPWLEKRLGNLWQACKNKVSGACGNDHVIAWTGVASGWIGNVISVVSEVNSGKREKQSPRSICTNYAASGSRFCISWAVYALQDMGDNQIQAIADNCWDHCQHIGKSCEVYVNSGGIGNYFCVSDRPDGCTAGSKINKC